MADFTKYTSGFVVSGQNIGIQAAKITTDTQGVVTAIDDWDAGVVVSPNVVEAKIQDDLTAFASTATVASAENAANAEKLQGLEASTFASAADLEAVSGVVETVTGDVSTLKDYFTNGSAKNAVNASSAAEATKLSLGQTINFGGNVTGTVTFNGTETKTADLTITAVPYSALPITTSGSMVADKVMDAENIAAYVDSKIAGVYKVKGSCAESELPNNAEVGDVWNLTEVNTGSRFLVGDNVVWTDEGWDRLAGTMDIGGKLDTTAFETWSAARFDGEKAKSAATADVALDASAVGGVTATTITGQAASGAAASAWINTSASDIEGAVANAADWADTKDNLIASAEKGAAASAWINTSASDIEGAVANAADWTATKDSLIAGAENGQKAYDWTSTNSGSIYNNVYATTAEDGTLLTFEKFGGTSESFVVSGKIYDVATTAADGLMSKDDKKALDDLVTASSTFVTSAFGTVKVNGAAYEASSMNDILAFTAGNGISLTPTADNNGHPLITIAATAVEPTYEGANGVTVKKEDDKIIVSGIDATTAQAGVTKAAYYTETDGLIHLF